MSFERARALLGKSVSRPTLYRVSLGGRVARSTNDYLELFCSSATIPARRLNTTVNLGHDNIGVGREVANTLVYSKPLSLSIIEPSDFSIYTDISQWFDSITAGSNVAGASKHMRYQNTYTADVTIQKLEYAEYDRANPEDPYQVVGTWTFHDAYPINISDIRVDSSRQDSMTTWSMNMTYTTYTYSQADGNVLVPAGLLNLLANNIL